MNVKSAAHYSIAASEVELIAIRAQGPGGQNVNKVSNAIHMRFDIEASSLPAEVKQRLRALKDRRITTQGVLIIKAQQARSLEKNRENALRRLNDLIAKVATPERPRLPTKPTQGSQRKRLETKATRSILKTLRSTVRDSN